VKILGLHGFLGGGIDWSRFALTACEIIPGITWEFPDLPGHGPRPEPVPPTFDGWVSWVREHLAATDGPVHLLGYSMGGRLALAAALAEIGTGRVASLTLLAASPGLRDSVDRTMRLANDHSLADQLERDGLDAFLHEWYQLPLFKPVVDELGLEHLVRLRRRGHASALASALRTAGQAVMPDLRPRLGRLDVPVLALAGDRDVKYMHLGEEIAASVPQGRFVPRVGAGHALLLEAPARCADAWCAFVTSLTSHDQEGDSP
jgi:2-succinyl-6-hydroxy-2,4-cyclohexadiene-1-carboxylate synthase